MRNEPRTRSNDMVNASSNVEIAARELAQRVSGTDEVLLLWHPESDQVEVFVRDVETGVGFHLDVAPGTAIDAFNHPYAYVARGIDG
jgi:hypothetical protein